MNDTTDVAAALPAKQAPAGVLADIGIVGNGQVTALVRADGSVPWCCWPRPDGDPIFCELLANRPGDDAWGVYAIRLVDQKECTLSYCRNTAILQSIARDARGNAIRILTWCPRYMRQGRLFRPTMLIRRIEPISGRPAVVIRLRPAANYGGRAFTRFLGSHHVRFADTTQALRVTTDSPVSYLAEERVFLLDRPVDLVLSDDETLSAPAHETAAETLRSTGLYWVQWVRGLAIPFEWQEATIRAAITLQLCTYDDNGSVLAAPTTSIPEAPESGRNWDYRYCWLRDAYFTVQAMNRLGATGAMEAFLRYLDDVVTREGSALLQPVYGITGEHDLAERTVETLPGIGGMGPVRVGNLAYRQRQHDVYGSVILASAQAFFDERLEHPGDIALFERLEALGERALPLVDAPDAGIWEFRGVERRHTISAAMCWASCDRLARIAARLGLTGRVSKWRERANIMRRDILEHAWNAERGTLSAVFDVPVIDASLLLLPELGLLDWRDQRFIDTVAAIESELRVGDFLLRYRHPDDFGTTTNAFTACSFWWANALAGIGNLEGARTLFSKLLAVRNCVGLLSEHVDPATGALWGNFPQTYSMVGIITTASRLSRRWEDEV
ncbi:MAG: glycoside hydrolase family 15 protein [Gammaproteobacteria bacterium]|nr:glycoside hydrolase family 15 protein [Gammaproteobacteria bacterium]